MTMTRINKQQTKLKHKNKNQDLLVPLVSEVLDPPTVWFLYLFTNEISYLTQKLPCIYQGK